jgi:gas vesicle protein
MNRETGNVLLGFLVGAVAGGVAALLFAPASGKETRQKLADGLSCTRDKLQEKYEHAKDYAKTQKDALKEGLQGGKEAYKRAATGKDETA